MRLLKFFILFLFFIFIVPALAHLAVWSGKDKPSGWSSARWDSAGILSAPKRDDAEIMLLAARTGGLKGAFATHSWLVIKRLGESRWHRYDVVGWGNPVRHNAYDADGFWYSNQPVVHHRVSGQQAAMLIPRVEAAIENYRWRQRGDYTLWPGPNSNTFVESIVSAVPELKWRAPSTAVGRDFPADGRWLNWTEEFGFKASLAGYAGIGFEPNTGIALNFLGLVAGVDWDKWQVMIPAFGTYNLLPAST